MKWLTILLNRIGWESCILAVLGRWLLCSGGCLYSGLTVLFLGAYPIPNVQTLLGLGDIAVHW